LAATNGGKKQRMVAIRVSSPVQTDYGTDIRRNSNVERKRRRKKRELGTGPTIVRRPDRSSSLRKMQISRPRCKKLQKEAGRSERGTTARLESANCGNSEKKSVRLSRPREDLVAPLPKEKTQGKGRDVGHSEGHRAKGLQLKKPSIGRNEKEACRTKTRPLLEKKTTLQPKGAAGGRFRERKGKK